MDTTSPPITHRALTAGAMVVAALATRRWWRPQGRDPMKTVRLRVLGPFCGQVPGEPANLGPALQQGVLGHDHPFRENAARLLILALYRPGRQGGALAMIARGPPVLWCTSKRAIHPQPL
jgi:hypothetical protein